MNTSIALKVTGLKNYFDVKVIKFQGDLDTTNSESALDQISKLINEGFVKIIADFSKLRYVNSTGMGVLMHFHKTAKDKMGFFKIASVNENVYEIMEIVGAVGVIEIFESLDEAVSSIATEKK